MACSLEPKSHGDVSQWTILTRKWVQDFISRYNEAQFTPYMHVFVYHVEYWMEKYESVEIFSNYIVESMHRKIKHRNFSWKNKSKICRRWLQMYHWERFHCPHSSDESENLKHTETRKRVRWTEETDKQREEREQKTKQRIEKMKNRIDEMYDEEEYFPSDDSDSNESFEEEDEEDEEDEWEGEGEIIEIED